MEKIIKKLFLSGCLVTAAAISFTALGSSSASAATQSDKTSTFSVTVPKSLTLSNVSENVNITADASSIKTANLNATVKTTAGFTISLHAATPALTSGSNTIPASSSLTAGTSGWGIKKKAATNSTTDATGYSALTATAAEFYRQTTAQTTAKAYSFVVGVATSNSQAPGTYSTTVTVTAANI